MPRKSGLFLLLASALATASCAGAAKVNFTPAPGAQAQPRSQPCSVQLFLDTRPARKYVDLGAINYHKEWHRTSTGVTRDEALESVQKRACEVGADALIDVQATQGRRLEFAFINVRATAIRFDVRN
jgi:hypothetical protein